MANRTINISLNTESVEDAIKYLNGYKNEMLRKHVYFKEKLLERLGELIREGFRISIADDIITPIVGIKMSDVEVSVDYTRGLIIAKGKEAVFIEFGAGVYYNGAVGSYPNPLAQQNSLGLSAIGTYGLGMGARRTWGYTNEQGEFVLTHGTPCSAPMYRAVQTVIQEYMTLAKEVFG